MSHPDDPEFALVVRRGYDESELAASTDPEEITRAAVEKFGLPFDEEGRR